MDPNLGASSAGRVLRELVNQCDPDWTSAPSKPVSPAAPHNAEPMHLPLLREALSLRDASLVIYRDQTLVEFKTELLNGVHRNEEDGHVSWQLGAFDDHHCHLALDAVQNVLFSAEPVSCQGNGLNYTVWFLTDERSGNPYRKDGYFSITLNRPYVANSACAVPRLEAIRPIFDLYRRFNGASWLTADQQFLAAFENGPPARP
jgi:hypothetical protein